MPDSAILVRDRKQGIIVRIRPRREPAKLRVCRACGRIHIAPATCRSA